MVTLLKLVPKVFLLEPIVAEASAILWALQLALEETHQNVMVEGDSKLCFDALECPNSAMACLSNYHQYPVEHLGVE